MKRRKSKIYRKDNEIRVRVTLAQKISFKEAAQRDGLEVSSWLRSLGVRAAALKPDVKITKDDQ